MKNGWRLFFAGLTGLAVSACADISAAPHSAAPPQERPDEPVAPQPAVDPDVSSATSQRLKTYYGRLQQDLLVQGLLRTDGGGVDSPFTDTQLAENFVQIALFDEYTSSGGSLTAQVQETRLRRWARPIRMSITFGDHVDQDIRTTDTNFIRAFGNRLSRLTGLPFIYTDIAPNFNVLVLNEDDRRAAGPLLRSLVPGIDQTSLNYAVNLPREQLCVVIGTFKPDGVTYDRAVAIIRAEHPSLMRQACVHEELAQGLGLANDSPRARPSIFNDDEEFAFLTSQDELLLKILYDPRLSVGMTAAEATPIVRRIATELTHGPV